MVLKVNAIKLLHLPENGFNNHIWSQQLGLLYSSQLYLKIVEGVEPTLLELKEIHRFPKGVLWFVYTLSWHLYHTHFEVVCALLFLNIYLDPDTALIVLTSGPPNGRIDASQSFFNVIESFFLDLGFVLFYLLVLINLRFSFIWYIE